MSFHRHGDLESGHQGSAQAVSSLLCPDPSSGQGKWAREQILLLDFRKPHVPWEPSSQLLLTDAVSHHFSLSL